MKARYLRNSKKGLDLDYYEELNQKYFHGTSTAINILNNKILPPLQTGVIREDKRITNRNVVYVTPNKHIAKDYAIKACKKFNGNPIVYEVIPDENSLICRINNIEYICDWAEIVDEVRE